MFSYIHSSISSNDFQISLFHLYLKFATASMRRKIYENLSTNDSTIFVIYKTLKCITSLNSKKLKYNQAHLQFESLSILSLIDRRELKDNVI